VETTRPLLAVAFGMALLLMLGRLGFIGFLVFLLTVLGSGAAALVCWRAMTSRTHASTEAAY
jgi:hypothetical protein